MYKKYVKTGVRTAYLICSDAYLAEDIFQEAFLQALKNIDGLKNKESFKTWFYRILTRMAYLHIKRRDVNIPVEKIEDYIKGGTADEYFEKQKYEYLYKNINLLKYKLKTVIILFYFNEMSLAEIAEVERCPVGTVKSRLFKARKQLKKAMEKGSGRDEL